MLSDKRGRSCDSDLPGVTVVVIGRNEGERLVRCLESVLASDYPADLLELIYVDSDSTDDSCVRAKAMGARVLRITEGPCSAARARNLGWRNARHDFVHFLDGDTVVHPQWFRKAVARLKDPAVGCVFGRLEEVRPNASIYMRVCAFDWHVPSGPWRLCGGDALFRRSALERLGGFREDLMAGEEPELSYRLRRLGLQIWRLDEPMALHDLNMTRFSQYWRRLVRSGWAYFVVAMVCRRGKERLWSRENLANVAEPSLWCCLLLWSAASRNCWGLCSVILLVVARLIWITVKVRRRADGWGISLLYGLHCLFSRIPILVGQIKAVWFVLARCPATLMEYKPQTSRRLETETSDTDPPRRHILPRRRSTMEP